MVSLSIIDKLEYANEYECKEQLVEDGETLNMRCWKHVWCANQNNDQLAEQPEILKQSGLKATVPNLLKIACE